MGSWIMPEIQSCTFSDQRHKSRMHTILENIEKLQGYDTDGTIEPADSSEKIQDVQEQTEDQIAIESAMIQPQPEAMSVPQNNFALDDAAQKKFERAQKFREDMFYDAVVSDTTVKTP